MTVQFRTEARTASADAMVDNIGASPVIEFFTGAAPANPAAADSGTKIASGNLPATPYAAAASGSAEKTGTWTVTGITAAGGGTDAGHFRIKDAGGCWAQGPIVEGEAADGELGLDNTNIADGQVVTITSLPVTIGGA